VARHFPDFLAAYREYALDGFVPDRFHDWVGRSVLAAALERKVTLKAGRVHHIPNIFVMLVSHPGIGKSTAIEAGTDLIEAVRRDHNPNFKIIPNQATEPALVDLMKITERIALSPTVLYPHSSAYFYASEASASALQNTCGDFVAAMTAFYDCPKWFRKKLKGEQEPTEIENSCMNLLAGATFNYLKTLVNEQSVLGGFASRLIYVVSPERVVREVKWGSSREFDSGLGKKLVEDLAHINRLVGPMTASPEFIAKYEEFQPAFDQYLIDLKSERLEAIMSRKGTNLIKLAMIFSVSEGDSRVVEGRHFDRALEVIEEAYADNPSIIASAAMTDKMSQTGVNQFIAQTLKKNGGELPMTTLRMITMNHGASVGTLKETIDYMQSAGWLLFDSGTGRIKLLIDPDRYL
jgi:hypothetical protein